MKDFLFAAKAYLSYFLNKEDLYSLQSSWIYSHYKGLLSYISSHQVETQEFENTRVQFLTSNEIIEVQDFGAGSKKAGKSYRRICDVAKYSTSKSKYCLAYEYLCSSTPAEYVLELGTCLGISTQYLNRATQGNIFTIEGSQELLRLAKSIPNLKGTNFIEGKIQDKLPELLEQLPAIDFALIDAHHTYQGTIFAWNQLQLKIHPKTILVIGDIHWSREMEYAWNEIKNNPLVTLSIDFFECGVLYFDYPGSKTNLILSL